MQGQLVGILHQPNIGFGNQVYNNYMPTKKSKKNKYPQTIIAEIDLHGMTVDEALHAVRSLVIELHNKNEQGNVRIITGKGINSPDGKSILRPAVAGLLHELRIQYKTAPIDQGGEGAFILEV